MPLRRLDLSVSRRIAVGFAIVSVAMILLLAVVHRLSSEVSEYDRRITAEIAPRAESASRLEADVLRLAVAVRSLAITAGAEDQAALEGAGRDVAGEIAALAALPRDPDDEARFAGLPALVTAYLAAVRAAAESGDIARHESGLTVSREAALVRLRAFNTLQDEKLQSTRRRRARAVRAMERAVFGIGALAVGLLGLASLITMRSIRRPVHELLSATRRLAAGDYTPARSLAPAVALAHEPRDELRALGQSFGRMALALEAREQELQAKNETLQAQQEELQSQSEEIQAQNEELHAQNEELQAQGEQLQETLSELRAGEDELLAADRNKSEFLAVLSHELRNPLAPIRNCLYVLDRIDPSSEHGRRALATIGRQVDQLARLVADLLDVTRISRGKVNLQLGPVELGRLIRQSADDHASVFGAAGLGLSLDVPGEPVIVRGDVARLAQVVGNLLHNASKFTPRGGTVRLELARAGDRAQIRVRDTGEGFDAQVGSRLFEPFMQVGGNLARPNVGLGLGLALVKGLAEMHGGTVRAESEGPGRGAEFVVELPLAGEGAVYTPAPPAPAAAKAGRGRRVLVIEDNLDSADSLRDVLAWGGHEVRVAHTGAEGVALAHDWRPEIVLCDVGLPDMDGMAVAAALRADPALGNAFLVALTGYALREDRRRLLDAGFHEHLAKPASIDALERLIESAPG